MFFKYNKFVSKTRKRMTKFVFEEMSKKDSIINSNEVISPKSDEQIYDRFMQMKVIYS